MTKHSLHNSIIKNIKARLSKDVNLVKFISAQLFLSENAVYKRIKGTTSFTLEEACILAKQLGISVDALIENNDQIFSFSSQAVGNGNISPVSYLRNIVADSVKLDMNTAHITYASNEFPIFQYFPFPKLNYFKFYLWSWTNWKQGTINDKKISFDYASEEIQEFNYLSKEIYAQYIAIPSTEFICLNSLHNTVQQIKYYTQIGTFASPTTALELCDEVFALIKHLEEMATMGKKFMPGNQAGPHFADFQLYNNEIIQSNNVCLISSSHYNKLFLTLDNPNTLDVDNMQFIHYVEKWFETMKKFAEPLGKESEKVRLIFFNSLQNDLMALRQYLEGKR